MKLSDLERFKRGVARAARLARNADHAAWLAFSAAHDLKALAEGTHHEAIKEVITKIAKEAEERARSNTTAAHNAHWPLDAAVDLLGAKEVR